MFTISMRLFSTTEETEISSTCGHIIEKRTQINERNIYEDLFDVDGQIIDWRHHSIDNRLELSFFGSGKGR